jgi:hypothetical protein
VFSLPQMTDWLFHLGMIVIELNSQLLWRDENPSLISSQLQ